MKNIFVTTYFTDTMFHYETALEIIFYNKKKKKKKKKNF